MLYLRHSASVWTPTSWQRKKKCVQLPKPSVTLSAISKGRISSQSMMTGVSEVTDFMTIDFNLQVEMRINNIRGKIIYFYMQIDLKYLYLCREIWGRVYFFTWKFQIGFKNSYFKDKMILSLFCNCVVYWRLTLQYHFSWCQRVFYICSTCCFSQNCSAW